MPEDFRTVPEELRAHAEVAEAYFQAHGYRVRRERRRTEYPYAPTLECKRTPTALLVEVDTAVRLARLEDWARYGRSSTKDTRVALTLPAEYQRSSDDEDALRDKGIGLYVSREGTLAELIVPRDLAMVLELPEIATLHYKLRKPLGPVYEHLGRAQWREAFEEACVALERAARSYLAKDVTSGRLTFVSRRGRRVSYDAIRIERMTLGQLAIAFSEVQLPTYADTVIADVLGRINADRVGVAHYKRTPRAEEKLRRNVGKHMWRVITAFKALYAIKD